MKYFILTVQPSRNKSFKSFRLGFDKETSALYFYKPLKIYLKLEMDLILYVDIQCGTPPKQAYDLNNPEIDRWIKANKFHCYPDRKPTKLIFSYSKRGNKIILTHYKNEINCL